MCQSAVLLCVIFINLICFLGEKKDIYDRYGKEGLSGNASSTFAHGHARRDPFFARGASSFHRGHFRDPFEVFQEFFGGHDPFADFFGNGKCYYCTQYISQN